MAVSEEKKAYNKKWFEEHPGYPDPEKRAAYNRAWYQRNLEVVREKHRQRNRQLAQDHPEKLKGYRKKGWERTKADPLRMEKRLERQRGWWEKDKMRNRMSKIWQNYRLTEEEYFNMLDDQQQACRICGKSFSESLVPRVDHDHDTGKVRGLLCTHCNAGLGMFQDSPEILFKASQYLSYKNPIT